MWPNSQKGIYLRGCRVGNSPNGWSIKEVIWFPCLSPIHPPILPGQLPPEVEELRSVLIFSQQTNEGHDFARDILSAKNWDLYASLKAYREMVGQGEEVGGRRDEEKEEEACVARTSDPGILALSKHGKIKINADFKSLLICAEGYLIIHEVVGVLCYPSAL